METNSIIKTNKKIKSRKLVKRNRLIFYIVCATLPLLQFCLFWFGTNLNSIMLAFKEYTFIKGEGNVASFVGFKNLFKNFGELFATIEDKSSLGTMILNSLLTYFVTMMSLVLSICFAYYITKKHWGAKTFQVLLFIPHIVSSIVMTILYMHVVEIFIPGLMLELFDVTVKPPFASGLDTARVYVLFYLVWSSFGTHTLLFCGSMNGISDSIFDAAKIDGAREAREFISIVVPMIMPTIMTFVITNTAHIFTHQMGLFTFFGGQTGRVVSDSRIWTVGYFLYTETKLAAGNADVAAYPQVAALGISISMVTIPIVLLTRKYLSKIGRY